MTEVAPLTGEEIVLIRGILRRRRYLMAGFVTTLGGALATYFFGGF